MGHYTSVLNPTVGNSNLKSPSSMSDNQVFVFAWRWNITRGRLWPFNTEDDSVLLMEHWLCNDDTDDYCFQLEKTTVASDPPHDNVHFQGYFKSKHRVRASTLVRALNARFPGIWLEPCSVAGREALKTYCMKAETRVAGPWTKRKVYLGKDLPTELWKWQADMETLLTSECKDDRSIVWIYDSLGAGGKTKFAKYMAMHYKMCVVQYARTENIIEAACTFRDTPAYIVDLTRAKPKDIGGNDLYSALEAMKNGMMNKTKFAVEFVLRDPPHVLVLANVMPEKGVLSRDRYIVYQLMPDHTLESVPNIWNVHG